MGALDGLKILELGQVVAAPFCGAVLADMGADVIKVEPPSGDSLRNMGPLKDGRSMWYLVENRNKRSISIDLKNPEGCKILEDLIAQADVMTENFKPGVLEKLGFDWKRISGLNPRIILARMSGYGQTGPYSNRYGYDRIGVGMGGLAYLTGFEDRAPLKPGVSAADYLVGYSAAVGILAAIYERDISGSGLGQVIDIGLHEPIFRISEFTALDYHLTGKIRERIGNSFVGTAPSGHWKTKDGKWVAVTCGNDRIFKRLVKLIDKEEWLERPEFATHPLRITNRKELDEGVEAWVATKTAAECFAILGQDVPVGPINSIEDIFNDPHIAARENLVEVDDKYWGKIKMQGIVPKMSRTPGQVKFPGPDLGADTNEVLMNVLGYSSAEIDKLRQIKAIN